MIEGLPSLTPITFFSVSMPCLYHSSQRWEEKYLLPSLSAMLSEENFFAIYAAWHEEGLFFKVCVDTPFQKVEYPDYRKGDSIELFIDTKDLKNKGFVSRFCHHFVFFAEPFNHVMAREMTRFRSDDMHPLCDPEDLQVNANIHKKGYDLDIHIPSSILHGYDPDVFCKLGFAYRINRFEKSPGHFCISSEEYSLERNPSLWGSLQMVK